MKKKKQPPSSPPGIPSPNGESKGAPLPLEQTDKTIGQGVPEGLVPAELLPAAHDVLAQLFASDETVYGSSMPPLSAVETEALDLVAEPPLAEGQRNANGSAATLKAVQSQAEHAESAAPPEAEAQWPCAPENRVPQDDLPPASDSQSEDRELAKASLADVWRSLFAGVKLWLKGGHTPSRKPLDVAEEGAATAEGQSNADVSDIPTTGENRTAHLGAADEPHPTWLDSPQVNDAFDPVAQDAEHPLANEAMDSVPGTVPSQAFHPDAASSAPSEPAEEASAGSEPTIDSPGQEAAASESIPDEKYGEASPARFDPPENTDLEAEDVADPRDDDEAIALAIERYASLTPPGPGRRVAASSAMGEDERSEASPEIVDINAVLEIPRDPDVAPPGPDELAASSEIPDLEGLAIVDSGATDRENLHAEIPPANVPAHELTDSPPSPASAAIPYRDWSFEEKLASHYEWVESKGTAGKRAELAGADLEGSDLIGVSFRFVDLHDASLRAADLLMADLRDACLSRCNFRDSCLVGANLEGANLEGALLETSMGLVPRQLAGANLHQATLPPQILQFDALAEFRRASRTVYGFFAAMMSLSALSVLLIGMTKDSQLLTNSAILFFLHSPAAAAALPTVQFYLIAPFALFIFYLVFHFHLQHLWDLVLELPAVFPDGRELGENEPRIVMGLMRTHFRWMNSDAPSTRFVEKSISLFVAYWILPLTLLFYWARFLTMQELRGTILQELLVAGATGVALYSTIKVGRPAERWTLQESVLERAAGRFRAMDPVRTSLAVLGILTFLAAGTMGGVPHSKERAPQFMAGSIRRWATSVLWSFGIDPYADLTEAVISTKPKNWNGADDQVSAVKGAPLNNANFRYAQAYRVFLANAHLLHANFQGAFLSQADLRRSEMGQSNLRYATLDQAQMNHVNLDRATLDGANLSRADLRSANLSYASLVHAALVDAHLDGATLYGANLFSATLIRTDFEKADLREAHLEGADLEHADMQGAYLWSAKLMGTRLTNAQLGAAIFVDADLRNADIRWAQLNGTVLTGADLTGADLDGADLRGAVGFGANQICSAKSRHGLLLDDAVQEQVTAQCGARN